MKNILILNGPNLNLLGKREPEIYGNQDFDAFFAELCEEFKSEVQLDLKQSNVEGELINIIHSAIGKYDAIILNAGGYTHTSVALADAVAAAMDMGLHVTEVHISNVTSREYYRHTSYLTPKVDGLIMGFGLESYKLAIKFYTDKA